MAKKILWAAFCALPGGQIVVQHFTDTVREHKTGDNTTEKIIFTAEKLVEGFKKQDVCVNIRGKITKNEVLVYSGEDITDNPRAANIVIEWAKGQGLEPIAASADQRGQDPKAYEYDKRIGRLETDVAGMKDDIAKILDAVTSTEKV